MMCEVRFQTVEASRRDEYIRVYAAACKLLEPFGCRRVQVFLSEEDPTSVTVMLDWDTRERFLEWRAGPHRTEFHKAIAGYQTRPSTGGLARQIWP